MSEQSERTVLVVDDLEDYCEELSSALSRDGFRVLEAFSAADAIEIGCSERPSIILSDWMLTDHVNGLDVINALSVVIPALQPILMTSFASSDLRHDARTAEVFDFLEKPLQLGQVREVVRRAAAAPAPTRRREHIAFFEVGPDGAIRYLNPPAEALLKSLGLPLDRLLPGIDLADATRRWLEIGQPGDPQRVLYVRGKPLELSGSTCYVVLTEAQSALRNSPLVCRLMGLADPKIPISVPIDGHILVLDDFETVRRVTMDVLKELNCVCHTARSHEEAIRLFSHDVDTRIVILDFEVPNANLTELVRTMRSIRPNVRFIGTSGGSHKTEFEAMGISCFLQKPWNLDQFFEALSTPSGARSTAPYW